MVIPQIPRGCRRNIAGRGRVVGKPPGVGNDDLRAYGFCPRATVIGSPALSNPSMAAMPMARMA
ncbi:MAG: hypothetical protein ABJQ08_18465, partial [Paracoccaceae bacterium]